jgi:hypothetical protein
MPVRSAPTVSDAVIDAVKLEMTMSAVNRPAELLGIAPSLEHPDQPPDHEQQRRQGGHHLKKRERKELLDHRQPAAVPIGRHGDAEPRDVERMTEVHDDLALGRHGDRRDRGVELPGLDPREQARQVRLPQLERVAELLGEAVPEIDADAAPRAVGVLDGEGPASFVPMTSVRSGGVCAPAGVVQPMSQHPAASARAMRNGSSRER